MQTSAQVVLDLYGAELIDGWLVAVATRVALDGVRVEDHR